MFFMTLIIIITTALACSLASRGIASCSDVKSIFHHLRKKLKTTIAPVDILSEKYSTFSSAVTEILSFSQTVRQSDRLLFVLKDWY